MQATEEKITQPLKWYGGKGPIARKIIEHMAEHTRYLEPYAGGLAVLLNKPFDGISEYVNDTNGELTHFWTVIADELLFERFKRKCEVTPLSEPLFDWAFRSFSFGTRLDPVSRAFRFFVMMRQSRQGLGKDYCTPTRRTRRGMNENVSAWLSAVDGLADVHQRLRRVEVWNRSGVEAIRRLDAPELLVYCDPPYLKETRSSTGQYGKHEMTKEDHLELLDTLGQMEGKFILSGYRSEAYDKWADWLNLRRVDIEVANHASGSRLKRRMNECLWLNY